MGHSVALFVAVRVLRRQMRQHLTSLRRARAWMLCRTQRLLMSSYASESVLPLIIVLALLSSGSIFSPFLGGSGPSVGLRRGLIKEDFAI